MNLVLLGPVILSLFGFQSPPAAAPKVPAQSQTTETPGDYVLGSGDQIVVRAADAEEIGTQPIPIDPSGYIDLQMVGRIKAAGLTTDQLATEIRDRLRKYLVHPDVSVYVSETRSQPISVLGAVKVPGVHQVQGQKTLFEVLSLAGGLREDAGDSVKITRKIQYGRIPLAGAKDDSTGEYSVASVQVKGIMAASDPAENIQIKPNDVISVPTAEIIYAIGALKKPGGYVLGSNHSLSALQILSLAGGLDHAAGASNAKIMRAIPGSNEHREIPIDVKKILEGKVPDVPLQANDILFVPTSAAKLAGYRTLEALITAGEFATYRIP